MTTGKALFSAVATTVVAAGAMPAMAQQSGVTFTGQGGVTTSNSVRGYSFTISQNFTLVGLGVWDSGGDGLASAHQVGLWDNAGNLLTSATVPIGATATLTDGFRYTPASYSLIGGNTYRVGAQMFSGGDVFAFSPSTVTPATGVRYNGGVASNASGLAYPTAGSGAPFGGNVLLAGAAPEPSAWALMILGFGIVGYALRRRRVMFGHQAALRI